MDEYKEIPLSQGKLAIVNASDFDWLSQWKWYYDKDGYAKRNINKDGKFISVRMHRLIMAAPAGIKVDHINCNGLHNWKANLRMVSDAESSLNRRKRADAETSIYKGVFWHTQSNKWRGKITIEGKPMHLGTFSSEIEAAKAYDKAAIQYHGEFAKINNLTTN